MRGFTLRRVGELPQAEKAAGKCVGLPFSVAKRAFNDDESWSLVPGDPRELPVHVMPCDWGRLPAKGSRCEVWLYKVDSGGSKIVLFVEDGVVVGAAGN